MHNKEIVLGVERVSLPKKMTTLTFCSNLMYWSMMFRQFSTIKINIKIMHVAWHRFEKHNQSKFRIVQRTTEIQTWALNIFIWFLELSGKISQWHTDQQTKNHKRIGRQPFHVDHLVCMGVFIFDNFLATVSTYLHDYSSACFWRYEQVSTISRSPWPQPSVMSEYVDS